VADRYVTFLAPLLYQYQFKFCCMVIILNRHPFYTDRSTFILTN